MKLRNSPKRQRLSALGALLALAASSSVIAGTPAVDAVDTIPLPNQTQDTSLALTTTNYFSTAFDGLDTRLGVSRYAGYGQFQFKLGGPWLLKVFVEGEYSLYSFDRLPATVPSPVLTSVLRGATFANVDATLAYTFAKGWAIVGGGRVTSGAATEANYGNSFTGGGILALKKSFLNGGVDVTLGASYTTRLARSAQVLPYVDVDVNVLPSFVTLPINFLLEYNGGILTYQVTDKFALIAMGQYNLRDYRLTNNLVASKGVWSERGVDLGGGFAYAPAKKNYALSIYGGYEVFRNVEVYARNGGKLFDRDVNPTPFVAVDFHASF